MSRYPQQANTSPTTRRCVALVLMTLIVGIATTREGRSAQPGQDDVRLLLDLPVLAGTGSEEDKPLVHVSCSSTRPIVEVATLTWESRAQLDETQRIDLTAYSDGFENNRYATLWPLERGQRPRALAASKLRHRDAALVPHLQHLHGDPTKDSTTVRLEGLQGGLTYRVRLVTLKGRSWEPGPVARFRAPVCVKD